MRRKWRAIGSLASGIAQINTPLQYVRDNVNFMQDAFRDMNKLLVKYAYLHKAADHNPNSPTQLPPLRKGDKGRKKHPPVRKRLLKGKQGEISYGGGPESGSGVS